MSISKQTGFLETRKGVFIFEYFQHYNTTLAIDTWAFEVWDDNWRLGMNKFNLVLQIMDNQEELKVIDLFAFNYNGKGIAIPIILKARDLLKKRIISASNDAKRKSFPGESNWPDAIERVWKPLVSQGLAVYDQSSDYFYLLP